MVVFKVSNKKIIKLPSHIDEIQLEPFCNAFVVFRQLQQFVNQFLTEENIDKLFLPENRKQYVYYVVQILGKITGETEESLFSCQLGDFENHILKLLNLDKEDNVVVDYDETFNACILPMYLQFHKVLTEFQPQLFVGQDFRFEVKGKLHTVPAFVADALRNGLTPPNLEAARVITILDAQITLAKNAEAAEEDKYFTGLVTMIAALSSYRGQEITSPANFEAYVQNRLPDFAELPVSVALNLDFFLGGTMNFAEKIIEVSSFGIHQK